MTRQLRSLPLRTPILDGEGLDSWIDALARRSGTSGRHVLNALGIEHVRPIVSHLIADISGDQLRRIEVATGLPPGRLDSSTGARLRDLGVLMRTTRFCPQCLADTDGRWQLTWRSNLTFACCRHGLILLDACPRCRRAPRMYMGQVASPGAFCGSFIDRHQRCRHDLSMERLIPASARSLAVQQWVDDTNRRAAQDDPEAAGVMSDIPLVMAWLSVLLHDEFERDANVANSDRVATSPSRSDRWSSPVDAALTAVAMDRVATLLDGDEDDSFALIRRAVGDEMGLPPPRLYGTQWYRLAGHRSRFVNRYLRAADPFLKSADRLRLKSALISADLPTTSSAPRIRWIPQLFWPDWSGRLLPVIGGRHSETFRATLAVMLTLPGDSGHMRNAHAALLHPRVTGQAITDALSGFKLDDRRLTDAIALLCRIAEYLDENGAPIDYQRRREMIPVQVLGWDQWRDLACSSGVHPGPIGDSGRFLSACRYVHELLTGNDVSDSRHELAFRTSAHRGDFLRFRSTVDQRLRLALVGFAEEVLDSMGIDEPLTWSPPVELAEGLHLPGLDVGDLDSTAIRRMAVDDKMSVTNIAEVLGIHIDHVRLALEQVEWPARELAFNAPVRAWNDEQDAAWILTDDYFQHEYFEAGKTLHDLEKETGIVRDRLARYAKQAGIQPLKDRWWIPTDPEWLRIQYCEQFRTMKDIAAELGTNRERVGAELRRLGITVRAKGVHSQTAMLAFFDGLPRLVRLAVEGQLDGWNRLHRFRVAMCFPSMASAAEYLNIGTVNLATQLRRLESETHCRLFERANSYHPQKPTPEGQLLLDDLESSDVGRVMQTYITGNADPWLPSADVIAEAEAEFRMRNVRKDSPSGELPRIAAVRLSRIMRKILAYLVSEPESILSAPDVAVGVGCAPANVSEQMRRLLVAGWLESISLDESTRLAYARRHPGPVRRCNYYRLTPAGLQSALRMLGSEHPRQATSH